MGAETPARVPPPFVPDTTPLREPEAIAARDREWLAKVYRPSEAQLTVRAAVMGMLLGGILSASNLYIGLKIGWSFGMGITSAVLGFAIFASLRAVFPGIPPLTVLENSGIGIAMVIDANDSIAMFVGALAAFLRLRARRDLADRYTVSMASGAIAGEGLMGIIVIFLRDVAHVLPH